MKYSKMEVLQSILAGMGIVILMVARSIWKYSLNFTASLYGSIFTTFGVVMFGSAFLSFLMIKKRHTLNEEKFKNAGRIFATSLIVGCIVGLMGMLPAKIIYNQNTSYTQEKWFDENSKYKDLMFDDFEKTHEIIGMSKADFESYIGNSINQTNDGYQYYIGFITHSIGVDVEIVEVTYENDIITNYIVLKG